ncbi:hypothetical protein [Deinococcus multiflagellatus]|uniref:ArsR family transcriptional regulator n=1 Tax=Deinococcus multiflagellatus TaxID=1656887 RepID=A0ABW1ZEE4_9DEIO|nr:hypothetical protein [Deinococcus multiflagellatus]MBZ9712969.1 hypothetical protein [Deinococcus multiflagellatus]
MTRVIVDDPSAVEVLLDSSKTRLLAPFMLGPHTIAAVAEATGQAQNALTYWVKRFVKLGLLTEVGCGRPAQYQAVTQDFLIDPSRVMPLEDMLRQLNEPIWARLLQGYTQEYRRVSPDWYVQLQITPDGYLIRRPVTPWQLQTPGAPLPELPLNEYTVIGLSREQARELKQRLAALVMEYFEQQPDTGPGEMYFLHLGLTRDAVYS